MRIAFRILFCLTFVDLISIDLSAQLSMDEFLRSANSDISLKVLDDQTSFIQQRSYTMSPINRFQFRFQNNEGFNRETQRFGLWLSPENPWAVSNNNRYFKTYGESLLHQRDIALKKALVDRYRLIIDYFFLSELQSLRQTERELLEAQLAIMEGQQSSDFFKAEDFAELKLKQIEKTVETEEALFELENQVAKIDLKYTPSFVREIHWQFGNVISVNDIAKIADTLLNSSQKSLQLRYDESRVELARQAYKIQKSNVNTGFIQGNYLPGNVAKEKTPWSMVAGVTIPIFNPNKGDMARKQLNVIQAENEKSLHELSLTNEKIMLADKLKSLVTRYRDTESKIKAMNIDAVASTLSQMNSNNPVVRVRLSGSAIRLQMILLNLKQSIFASYIDFLSVTDQLQQRPLSNYLTPGLTRIE
jgi:hypothetical protein